MKKLRMELEELKVESFEASAAPVRMGTVAAFEEESCSMKPTCGVASRGEETFEMLPASRYVCCV
jgi:hypothetical protein